MPVTTHIDPGARLVTFRCREEIALAQVKKAFEQMLHDPGFEPGLNALWDMRAASIGVRAHEISDILDMIQSHQKERGTGYRVGILVGGSPDFGLSTMFEMSAHAMPFAVRVFRSYSEATRWLEGEEA
jgi:hypothetical protein